MALDDKDRAEIMELLKSEIGKLLAAGPTPGVAVRFVGIPIDISSLGRFPGRFPGVYTSSGDVCCNGCD
ncbi:MAG TPA: hypothetical protein VFX28_08745 [Methylomirabilota bacterium]|nr:hypothetical protein [Methylomirabilota bacterium]